MDEAKELYEQGLVAFTEDRTSATAFFYKAVAADPKFQAAWCMLASCTSDVLEQRRFLKTAIDINPESDEGKHAAQMLEQLEKTASGQSNAKAQVPPPPSGDSKNKNQQEVTLAPQQVVAGKYEIVRRLGNGGFGEAWLARYKPESMRAQSQLHNQLCVVKHIALPSDEASVDREEVVEAIEREADMLIALNNPGHENIPYFLDYLGPERCLVMKYVEGETLTTILAGKRRKRVSATRALRYMHNICSALAYMHYHEEDGKRNPKIHRDVKPENIVIGSRGRAWLVDYGIAQAALQDGAAHPPLASGLGTPGYMAPEQMEGHAEPRSDIYALGVTLRTLVTGQEPSVDSGSAMPTGRQIEQPATAPRGFGLQPRVERLIQQATAPTPAERPTSRGLLTEIEHLLALSAAYTTTYIVLLLLVVSIIIGLFAYLSRTNSQDSSAKGTIQPGQTVTEILEQPGPAHLWTFDGAKDTLVTIVAQGDRSTDTDPIISLKGPAPTNVVRDSSENSLGSHDSVIDKFPLYANGVYTIRVAAATQGGKYSLSLQVSKGKKPDESDWSLSQHKDDTLSATCKSGDPSVTPEMNVLDAAGKQVSISNERYTFPRDGRYTLQVKHASAANSVCQFTVTNASQTDESKWMFDAHKDDTLNVTCKMENSASGSPPPEITLLDPAKEPVVGANNQYTLPKDGQYTLQTKGANGTKSACQFSVTSAPRTDESKWTFDGHKDETLSVSCQPEDAASTTGHPPEITLLDKAGGPVSGANNQYTLPKDDGYVLQVKSANGIKPSCRLVVSGGLRATERTIELNAKEELVTLAEGTFQDWKLNVNQPQPVTVRCELTPQPTSDEDRRDKHLHLFVLNAKGELIAPIPWTEGDSRYIELNDQKQWVIYSDDGKTTTPASPGIDVSTSLLQTGSYVIRVSAGGGKATACNLSVKSRIP